MIFSLIIIFIKVFKPLSNIKKRNHQKQIESLRGDSNPRLPPYQGGALPPEPLRHNQEFQKS